MDLRDIQKVILIELIMDDEGRVKYQKTRIVMLPTKVENTRKDCKSDLG